MSPSARGNKQSRDKDRAPRSHMPSDEIQDAYLKRAIAEMSALNEDIAASSPCHDAGVLPVLSSGSPQAEVAMIKWSASLAERQEGVAFFGRAGSAILKSAQRLGIDPLTLYGTLCVKCEGGDDEAGLTRAGEWLERVLAILSPKLVVVMGPKALEFVNGLDHPLAVQIEETTGEVQQWTPSTEAVYVPDIDESLDEQSAKRRFWAAFRQVGHWHEDQPPY